MIGTPAVPLTGSELPRCAGGRDQQSTAILWNDQAQVSR